MRIETYEVISAAGREFLGPMVKALGELRIHSCGGHWEAVDLKAEDVHIL